jgi:hypothetical protein
MAATVHGARGLWLPRVDGLLQEIHPLIRIDHRAAHQAAQAGRFPLVTGGRDGIRVPEGSAHLRVGAPTP